MVEAVPADVLAKVTVGRLCQANEIARGVAFLCGEEAIKAIDRNTKVIDRHD